MKNSSSVGGSAFRGDSGRRAERVNGIARLLPCVLERGTIECTFLLPETRTYTSEIHKVTTDSVSKAEHI